MTMKNPVLATALALAAIAVPAGAAQAADGPVSVYPSPGARTAEPGMQLSFRNVAPAAIGALDVVGSSSGVHSGRLAAHSDGDGASFLPDRPFAAGETVTVHTGLDVAGARDGAFALTVADPGPPLRGMRLPKPIVSGPGVQKFHSRHDLVPPRMTVDKAPHGTTPGNIFLGAFSAPGGQGPGQVGPMILDAHGRLVWFHPLGNDELALDVRVQSYRDQPVLTWWQGVNNVGLGNGVGEIYDRSYRRIAEVHAGNGLMADPHEFLLTDRGTALLASENPVKWDASKAGGAKQAVVWDSVVQEIDVATGLVLFEWHSLDHVPVEDSHTRAPTVNGHLYDYFHINSIAELPGGDYLVSSRNMWAVYKIDGPTGALHWTLGGKHSDFRAGRGVTFSWQHDARVQPDGTISIFDDGPSPDTGGQSRGIGIHVDTRRRTATLVHDYRHGPKLLANSQGNMQTLPSGNVFVGWGSQPHLSEFSPHGQLLFDASFPRGGESYRAYRFPWSPAPTSKPAVAASTDDGTTTVYASWNGAGNVARWQVLAGRDASSLRAVASATRADFETTIAVKTDQPLVAVQAKDARGRVLATSKAIKPIRG